MGISTCVKITTWIAECVLRRSFAVAVTVSLSVTSFVHLVSFPGVVKMLTRLSHQASQRMILTRLQWLAMVNEETFEQREQRFVQFCQDQVTWHSTTARRLSKYLSRLRTLVLLCSVIVTVISGIPEIKTRIPWAVTVAAGISTFCAGLLGISKAEEKFLNYVEAAGQFRRELLLYQARGGVYAEADSEKRFQLFAERVISFDEKSYAEYVAKLRSSAKSS